MDGKAREADEQIPQGSTTLTHLPTDPQYNKDLIITGRPIFVKSLYFSPKLTKGLKRRFWSHRDELRWGLVMRLTP